METNKKIKLLDFKLTKNLGASLFGVYKSRFTGTGMDFVKHKEYTPGDPIKNIDWKALSKTDKLYSKVFEDERDLKVLFLIDVSKSIDFGVFEKTKKEVLEEIFYSVALSSNINGDSIGAVFYDGEREMLIEHKKGFGNIFKVLNDLENISFENYNLNRTKNIFKNLHKRSLKNNLIFVLTDDMNLINDKNVKLLSLTNEIIYFNIFDYFENNLTDVKLDLSLYNKNSFLNISLKDSEKIKEFRKKRWQEITNFENFLKKNKISYKIIDTKDDVFRELYLFFSKRLEM